MIPIIKFQQLELVEQHLLDMEINRLELDMIKICHLSGHINYQLTSKDKKL